MKGLDTGSNSIKCPFNHEKMRSIDFLVNSVCDFEDLADRAIEDKKCYGYKIEQMKKGHYTARN